MSLFPKKVEYPFNALEYVLNNAHVYQVETSLAFIYYFISIATVHKTFQPKDEKYAFQIDIYICMHTHIHL